VRAGRVVLVAGEAGVGGWYVAPTVFAGVDNDMRIAREEIFGPVLSVIAYQDEADAVRIANDSDYGLGGAVWTGDIEHGMDIARRIRTGTCGINTTYMFDPGTPFGGYKAISIISSSNEPTSASAGHALTRVPTGPCPTPCARLAPIVATMPAPRLQAASRGTGRPRRLASSTTMDAAQISPSAVDVDCGEEGTHRLHSGQRRQVAMREPPHRGVVQHRQATGFEFAHGVEFGDGAHWPSTSAAGRGSGPS
jgi:Aldehyde dehydrogenase family